MELSQRTIGRDLEGGAIEGISIRNKHGIAIKIISFGSTLASVKMPDAHGISEEITLGFDDLSRYLGKHPYFGATIGRYANRIAHGRFRLNGREYTLFCNKGRHHLHGGRRGFDHVTWKASSWSCADAGGVHLTYTSLDGEEGYPGTLSVQTTYSLDEDDNLQIDYEATTDSATPVNLTNHTYWNLRGAGTGDIKDHRVRLYADQYLPVDAELIPTGRYAAVENTPFDFRAEKSIGQEMDKAGGYDHCFVIRRHDDSMQAAARVHEPTTGRGIEIHTNQPGIQFYSGNMLPDIVGRQGKSFSKHTAFCLETEGFPDAVNQPGFPNQILQPSERYQRLTRIHFFRQ